MKKFLLLCFLAVLAAGSEIENKIDLGKGAYVTTFQDTYKADIMALMKRHFDFSIKYLYTSVGFGNQLVERPGMSAELKEQSDSHWEDGMSLLKKFLQRGGETWDLHNFFQFEGKNTLIMDKDATKDTSRSYMKTLLEILADSKQCTVDLITLNKIAIRKYYDGDWTRYFEEKLEKEAGRVREMAGHVTNLEKMLQSGIALHFFDEKL